MRRHIFLSCTILAAIILSCNTPEKKEASVSTATSTTEENSIAVAQRMFDAFNAHDWKKMADSYADDALYLDPSYGIRAVHQSKDSIIQKYSGLAQYIPNIKDSITGIFACGNKVSVEFISVGTAPGNKRFELPITTVLTIKDSLIVQDNTYYDQQ